MGVIGGDGVETQFHNDIDVTFKMSGETDNGISFGGAVDLDEAGNLGREEDNMGVVLFVQGAFGKLSLGDVPDALTYGISVMGTGNPGSIDDSETAHAGFIDVYGDGVNDDQVLRYEHTIGAFGVAASYEQGAAASDGVLVAGDGDGSMAVGATYNADMGGMALTLGAGYMTTDFGTSDDQTIIGAAVTAEMTNGFSAGVTYSSWSNVEGSSVDATHLGIGAGYTMDAISLHVNYGVVDVDADDSDFSGLGFAAAYDLGGGAAVKLGYGSSDYDDPAETDADTWSLGVTMKF